jgi:hypothetical protein
LEIKIVESNAASSDIISHTKIRENCPIGSKFINIEETYGRYLFDAYVFNISAFSRKILRDGWTLKAHCRGAYLIAGQSN